MKKVILGFVTAVALTATFAVPAQAVGGFTQFVKHPSIAAQPVSGSAVTDLMLKGSKLYMGYGDYTGNTGPIDVATVDTVTGATAIELDNVPTEELHYRKFGTALYAPWVDPRIDWNAKVGFSTDSGGLWKNVFAAPAIHVFDVAVFNGATYMAGSVNNVGAGIYRSTDGVNWQLVLTEVSSTYTGWERFYWLSIANGKLCAQAQNNGGTASAPLQAPFSFRCTSDGLTWSKKRPFNDLVGATATNVESFKGLIYYRQRVFDGTGSAQSIYPTGFNPTALYADGDYLYATGNAGEIYRTAGNWSRSGKTLNPPTWSYLGKANVPATATDVDGVTRTLYVRSLAVSGSTVYLGMTNATVWKGSL